MVAGSGAQLQIVIRRVRVGLMCQVPFSQDSDPSGYLLGGVESPQGVDSLAGLGRVRVRSLLPAFGTSESAGDAGAQNAVRERMEKQPKYTVTTCWRNGMVSDSQSRVLAYYWELVNRERGFLYIDSGRKSAIASKE